MTPTAFCKLVEARLGWSPPDPALPEWQRYQSEAAKVKRRIEDNPVLYSWRNLSLAVELLRRQRIERTPIGVFAYVPAAIDAARVEDDDLELQISHAVAFEFSLGDPDGWGARMTRARGAYRVEVYREWQQR